MNGGYYRIDLSDTLSVLALNTLYYSIKNDKTIQNNEDTEQLSWLTDQFKNADSNKKFILTYHIYPGARYRSEP